MRWILGLAIAACEPPGYGHHADASVDGTGDATIDAGRDATAADHCDHAFRLDGHGAAAAVWLTGDFVAWGDGAHGAQPFTLGADGAWTGTRSFTAGTYLYKFIVDTEWIADPTDALWVDDGFGGHNSVYSCVP